MAAYLEPFQSSLMEVVSVVVTDIFDAEVTDNEDREDGAPLVVPNARSGGYVIVASHVELSLEEFVGKDSRLWETVDAFSNLEID